jgi:biotin carboxyl carrier protein
MNQFKITVNGNEYFVNVEDLQENSAQVEVNGLSFEVGFEDATGMSYTPATAASAPKQEVAVPAVKQAKPVATTTKPAAAAPAAKSAAAAAASSGGAAIVSPLPGVIVDINVKVGDEVKSGQKVLVLEAMKMENNINADRDGKVVAIKVGKGDSVLEGDDLIIIG